MRRAAAAAAACVLIGLCFASLAGCGGSPAPTVFKIGVVAELTGSIPSVGESCKRGATLAVDEINNAGGIGPAVEGRAGGQGLRERSEARCRPHP